MIRRTRIALVGCSLLMSSCVANTARQSMAGPPAPAAASRPSPPLLVSEDETHMTSQTAQQSGQGNVTGQIDAHGWKGFEFSTAVPVGQVVLMGLMLWLSHRREVLRIKQNGKHVLNGSPGA